MVSEPKNMGNLAFVLSIIVLVVGIAYFLNSRGSESQAGDNVTAYFICDNNASIRAIFYPKHDEYVDLVLSDGRSMKVPRAISASGARYATSDESFVFWNKGNTAFIDEKGIMTYKNCTTQ